MNKIIIVLFIFLSILIYKFTSSDTSYFEYQKLKNQVANLKEGNDKLSDKIKILKAEIKNLRTGLIVIEEKARNELGLIKEKETFYQILE
tara:strand:+ start:2486 stop:2755 length:270 start_codon:yes stop_codon:yes gene_type:complete